MGFCPRCLYKINKKTRSFAGRTLLFYCSRLYNFWLNLFTWHTRFFMIKLSCKKMYGYVTENDWIFGEKKTRKTSVLRRRILFSVLATANPSWTRFGATNKAIYCSKKSCRFLNRLRFFNLSMSLFVCSKFASNLLTHNRRGGFNRERRRNIKIFQAFICWKAPSIMRYRRV